MTPEPVVLTPDATIAEALARIRSPDLTPALASMVFVCRPPQATPTGRYLGCVHTQRLLREPPFELVAGALDTEMARLSPDAALTDVTRFFASYNLVCAPGRRRRGSPARRRHRRRRARSPAAGQLAGRGPGRRPGRRRQRPAAQRRHEPRGRHVADTRARRRLDQPRSGRRFSFDIDPETFGRFSESLARFMGTGTFLFWQTLLVITWITLNLVAVSYRWDPYPFILLNLAFSTQAAYAAPLILLAQNRQDDRDRITLEEDRNRVGADQGRHRVPRPRAGRAAGGHRRGRDPRLPARRTRPAAGGPGGDGQSGLGGQAGASGDRTSGKGRHKRRAKTGRSGDGAKPRLERRPQPKRRPPGRTRTGRRPDPDAGRSIGADVTIRADRRDQRGVSDLHAGRRNGPTVSAGPFRRASTSRGGGGN